MNDHVIRQAVTRDAAQLVDIHSRSVSVLCSGDYTAKQIEAWIGKRTQHESLKHFAPPTQAQNGSRFIVKDTFEPTPPNSNIP